MENLLWLLIIGAVFFFMHRMGLGCCGGHNHKDHSHGGDRKEEGETPAPKPVSASAPMVCCGGHDHGRKKQARAAGPERAEAPALQEAAGSRTEEGKKVEAG